MRRTLAALVASVALAVACTPPPAPTGSDVVVVGTTESRSGLDPAACYAYLCAYALLPNTHQTLVTFEPGTLDPSPGLAESWTVSDDGLTYTFTLRTGVRLHDGTTVDAETVRWSLDRIRTLSVDGGPAFILFQDSEEPTRGVRSVEAPDPRTVVVSLAAPDASLPARLAHAATSIVSPEAYPAGRRAGNDLVVGSGPYRSDGFRPDGSIELSAWDGWAGDEPPVARVLLRPYRTGSDLAAAVERGDVDVAMRSFAGPDALRLGSRDGLDVSTSPSPTIRFLAFGADRPPFDVPAVRAAVGAAVDRDALARVTGGEALDSLVPPAFASHVAAEAPGDVDALLEGAGVAPGERIGFTLWYTPDHYGPQEQEAAEALAGMLEGTGRFAVSLRSAPWSDFRRSFSAGDYQAWLLGWFPDVLDPDDYLAPFVSSAAAAALGSRYASPRADELVVAERAAVNARDRATALAELQRLVAADSPYVPLWQPRQHTVVREGVRFPADPSTLFRAWRLRIG